MNVPEYRAAVRAALNCYREEVQEAAERLGKALAEADVRFFEDDDRSEMARAAEPYDDPVPRLRRRDA